MFFYDIGFLNDPRSFGNEDAIVLEEEECLVGCCTKSVSFVVTESSCGDCGGLFAFVVKLGCGGIDRDTEIGADLWECIHSPSGA